MPSTFYIYTYTYILIPLIKFPGKENRVKIRRLRDVFIIDLSFQTLNYALCVPGRARTRIKNRTRLSRGDAKSSKKPSFPDPTLAGGGSSDFHGTRL